MNSLCPHELVQETGGFYEELCNFCEERITGPHYRCFQCFKYLHKTCLQPSNQIQHPFHPQHPLFLKKSNTKTSCNACKKDHETPTYNCFLCSFCLHFGCSKLTPTKKTSQGGGGELLLPDHPHTLLLCSNEFKYCSCDYCRQLLDDLIYVCLECNLSLHKNCAQCPLVVHQPFHPQHPLRLRPYFGSEFECSYCKKSYREFCYRCEECDYTLDASCSCFMPIDIKDNARGHKGGALTLLQPNHIYSLLVLQEVDVKSCGACEQLIKEANDPIYFCSKCEEFFHKSCAELLRDAKTPIDPIHHLLNLEDECVKGPFSKGRQLKICSLCGQSGISFVYRCSDCEIMLHLKCFSFLQQSTTFMSINHHHPLILYRISDPNFSFWLIRCSKCEGDYSFPFFSCFLCKLHLHACCLPKLPTTIKSPYHRHSLILTYSAVKDWPDEPDYADFYCDNCEEERNLHEPTYYCEPCHFVAHFGCLLTQVMHALEEEWSVASNSGNLIYDTYDDISENLLVDINTELEDQTEVEEILGKGLEEVREKMKDLKEAHDKEDLKTLRILLTWDEECREAMIYAVHQGIQRDETWVNLRKIAERTREGHLSLLKLIRENYYGLL